MLTFPEHILEKAPWSVSKLGVIEQCSLKFDLKYNQRTEEAGTFTESRVGVAVHSALELSVRGSPINQAMQYARESSDLTHAELQELDARIEQIENFTSRMKHFRKKYGVIEEHVESRWGMDQSFDWCGYYGDKGPGKLFFRGAVDYAMYTKSKHLIIIDHKSGKQRDLEHYQTQLRVYSMMALARFPEAKGVQCAINFVMPDKMEWDKYVSAETIKGEYRPWLHEHMSKVCAGLLDEPKPTKTKLCDWCGYKSICPAHGEVTRGKLPVLQ